MKLQFLMCLSFALVLAMVRADEFDEIPNLDSEEKQEKLENVEQEEKVENDGEKPKVKTEQYIVEDSETKTSSLVESDVEKSKIAAGYCHYGIAAYFKRGYTIRCGCLKCACSGVAGRWVCDYHFAYCPYYYCGNKIYNPHTQLCCCGKVYSKKANWRCCGYFYIYSKTTKCCNYYTPKPLKANCPKFRI